MEDDVCSIIYGQWKWIAATNGTEELLFIMKKCRIVAIILLIMLVTYVAGCRPDSPKRAYIMYRAAIEKTLGQNDLKVRQGETTDTAITVKYKTVNVTGQCTTDSRISGFNTPEMMMESDQKQSYTASGNTQSSYFYMYLDRDNIYVKHDYAAYKVIDRSSAEAEEYDQFFDSVTRGYADDLTEEMFKRARISGDKDGTHTIELVLTGEQMRELAVGFESSLGVIEQTGAEDIEYEFKDVAVTLTIDPEGFLTKIQADYVIYMDMLIQGNYATATGEVTSFTEYTDIGQPVSIKIPAH